MKYLFFKSLCLGLFVFASTTSASFIVDLDANPNSPVYLTLEAGDYQATPFAGTYTAWNAWASVSGGIDDYPISFDQRPPVGWLNSYTINDVLYSDGFLYYTAEDALANAVTAYFTVETQQTVKFQIQDSPVYDNWGGISLDVQRVNSSVPEPATLSLLCIGLLGLVGVSRKKK